MFRVIKTVLATFAILFAVTGCQTAKTMPIEGKISNVVVGHSTSDQLLNMFDDEKILQTTEKISALNDKGKFNRELAIVSLEPDSSNISRYVYMSRDKNLANVKLRIIVSTKVGPEVLLMPYASENDKSLAIIRYCRQMLRDDAKEFANDKELLGLMDLSSMVISTGVVKMEESPRDISDINTDNGFTYEHMTAGECKLRLTQGAEKDIYTLSIHTRVGFDWLVKW